MSDKCGAIQMDTLITGAARALAAGDPLGARAIAYGLWRSCCVVIARRTDVLHAEMGKTPVGAIGRSLAPRTKKPRCGRASTSKR